MKADELMIGDYVQYDGCPWQVIGINPIVTPMQDLDQESRYVAMLKWTTPAAINWVNVGDLQPIEVTEEIMIANGFVLDIDKGLYLNYEHKNSFSIYHEGFDLCFKHCHEDKDGNFKYNTCIDLLPEAHYVHQLQHALRLAGFNNFKIEEQHDKD